MRSSRFAGLPSLVSFRSSILAAIGLAACGGSVTVEGSGGSNTTSSTSGTGGNTPGECAGAQVVPTPDGSTSGFSRCPDGTIHKSGPSSCNVGIGINACTGSEMQFECKTDAECGGGPHGRCASVAYDDFNGPVTACQCIYPCANDDECGPGKVCVCAGVVQDHGVAFCATGQCTNGSDCPTGECGLSAYPNGCYTDVELACRNPDDACRTDGDCAGMPGNMCVIDGPNAAWACLGTGCAIGRPLLVQGEARTAAPIARADWSAADVTPDLAGLDETARVAIAAHWLDIAALEHASVASFARFTLELLSLGAPARLIAEAQQAGLDEVEHARLAYAIAGAYGGLAVGPGALDLSAVSLHADRRAIVRALIAEGCVGETLGVAEAMELAGLVRDPAIQGVHARIVADEQRHAELAWRTLAWLLAAADEEMVRFASACFEEAIASMSRDPAPPAWVSPDHGLLSAGTIGAVRRRALAEVVAPCAAALLASARRAPAEVAVAHA
ncbi:MAG: ferritin-like domain-containing protein [Minicystis sp.]